MKKVLVLSFHIQKNIKDLDYLSEGILEELIDLISLSDKMRATSRSISLYLKDNPSPGTDLVKQFGIDYIIEGSIKSVGDKNTITMRLVDARNEDVLNVARLPFDPNNWTVQLPELLVVLFEGRSNGMGDSTQSLSTKNKVRELYLKGLYHWNRYSHNEMLLAIGFFKRAIKEDNTYAPAFAGLADSYSVIAIMGYEDTKLNFELARENVVKALALNDKHSDSYVCAAMINMFYEKDFPKAKSNLSYALKLNRNNLKAHHFMSFYYVFTSQLDLSEKHALITLKEDPLSTPHYASLIRISLYNKNFSKALEYIDAAMTVDPESLPIKDLRGQTYLLMGNVESAIEEFKSCIANSDDNPLNYAFLAYAYSLAGFHEDSRTVEATLSKINTPNNTGIFDFAIGIIKLGRHDYDGFFKQLNKAIGKHLTAFIGEMLYNPIYSEIRKDKRYEDVLARFNLNPDSYQSRKKIRPSSTLTIKTNTQEKLNLDPQDIAYVEGEGNYCTVYWHEEGLLQNRILRVTLKQLEEQFITSESIIRCHKSFIINLNEDLKLSGNAKGHFFSSPFFPIKIPVSRSKNDFVRKYIS